VRRATGRPISAVLRDEVAAPLGVADELYFGMPVAEHGRLARLEDPADAPDPAQVFPPDAPFLRAAPVAVMPTAELGNRTDVLAADIPAGGKMTARAIARMYAALLGEVDGVRLLDPDRAAEVTAPAFTGADRLMGNEATWALGYAVGLPGQDGPETVFGMAGAGGTYAYADRATGLAVAVAKNRLTMDFAAVEEVVRIVAAVS